MSCFSSFKFAWVRLKTVVSNGLSKKSWLHRRLATTCRSISGFALASVLTTTNLSYRFPIFETSATALCGTTGINCFRRSVSTWLAYPCVSTSVPLTYVWNIRVSWAASCFLKKGVFARWSCFWVLWPTLFFIFTSYIHYLFTFCFVPWYPMDSQFWPWPGITCITWGLNDSNVSLCEEGEMRRGPQETGDVEHSFTYIFKWLDHDIPPIFPNCSSSGNIFPHLFSCWGRMAEGSTFEDEGRSGHLTGWHSWMNFHEFSHLFFTVIFSVCRVFGVSYMHMSFCHTKHPLTYDSCEFSQVTTWKWRRKPDSQTKSLSNLSILCLKMEYTKYYQVMFLESDDNPLELRYHRYPIFQDTSVFVLVLPGL